MKGQFIYKIINTVNGKFYVGSTTNTRERFRTHRNRLRGNRHHASHLQAAWNKYGEAVFVFHVIQEVPEGESLQAAEDVWLAEHVGKPHCYNKSRYSDTPMRGIKKEDHPCYGRERSDEERARIAAGLKAAYAADPSCHPRLGKQHSDETKETIRQAKLANPTKAWLGLSRDEATKAKISAAQKGKPKAPGRKVSAEGMAKILANIAEGRSHRHWKGRTHTDEAKEKMSRSIRALKPDGTTEVYKSITYMRDNLGVSIATVIKACKSGAPIKKGLMKGWTVSYSEEGLAAPE
jgi:group I intron endonuclease